MRCTMMHRNRQSLRGFPFPPIPAEQDFAMAHLYCYFDESGKHGDHPIVCFNGFVDSFDNWRIFQQRWLYWLKHYGLKELHAVEALRYSQPYGDMKPGSAEERAKNILPFIREIAHWLALGIA